MMVYVIVSLSVRVWVAVKDTGAQKTSQGGLADST